MAGLHLAITDDEEEQEPEPQLPAAEEKSSTGQNDEENEDTVLDFDEFIREMQVLT